ncbi:tyrosine-type recombinase/integrase [Novosphingobium mangrovi (ex Huang et al. 2023)]|uniref:Integrase arm-type DNA-binding domain-containing protein n=1 Tax=Novosphingobium mangrovi (ex Huang et al. 2023) TaxID=2976432 RepID=A0ABT2I1H2_9SPHN|nr:integrase arm-type DNA-binding domain-containing protein [Novosphingobium mangrovi (ex Huang et al. 2023)]MCT2398655.1 integrase arm-type DNA-binding domain-containing protein [Novosphingobium mangrovi (ex Huang et al. 2023)]
MNTLFATTVLNAKPAERDYKLSDGGGLYLLIKPSGSKLWRMNYRYLGKHRPLSFGAWPEVSLADARVRREDARRMIAAGLDPSHEQKLAAAREKVSEENSFKLVAEEWVAKNEREGMAEITLSKIRWLLEKAYPKIGNRPVAKITAQEVLGVLRAIEATGRYESARRMRCVLSRVFRYAIATTRAEHDPARDLRGALTVPKAKHLAAITTEKGAGELMRAIEGYTGHAITLFALRLSAHLFVRPGELRQAEWSEFDFDRSLWNIPAEKMKMRRPHRVPLSRQVTALFEQLWDLTGTGRYCFPSFRSPRRPMSENTVNAALRVLGFGPAVGYRRSCRPPAHNRGRQTVDLGNTDARPHAARRRCRRHQSLQPRSGAASGA